MKKKEWRWFLLGWTGFYRVFLGFTGFYRVGSGLDWAGRGFYLVFIEFYRVYRVKAGHITSHSKNWRMTGFQLQMLVSTGLRRFLPVFTGFYWVSRGLIGPQWFLLGLMGS